MSPFCRIRFNVCRILCSCTYYAFFLNDRQFWLENVSDFSSDLEIQLYLTSRRPINSNFSDSHTNLSGEAQHIEESKIQALKTVPLSELRTFRLQMYFFVYSVTNLHWSQPSLCWIDVMCAGFALDLFSITFKSIVLCCVLDSPINKHLLDQFSVIKMN